MNWSCTLCGSCHWPDSDSSCPLCNDGGGNPEEREEGPNTAQERAVRGFTGDGCRKKFAISWWNRIDRLTDEEFPPDVMAEMLASMHDEACDEAWRDLEVAPTSSTWADACAIAGFDICKNYSKERK